MSNTTSIESGKYIYTVTGCVNRTHTDTLHVAADNASEARRKAVRWFSENQRGTRFKPETAKRS